MIGTSRKDEPGQGWLQGDVSLTKQLMCAVAGIVIAVTLTATPILRPFENWSMDERLSIRGDRTPFEDVKVVAINQPSLDALRSTWPVKRRLHGQMIDKLRGSGAKVIAYDIGFKQPSNQVDDDRMINAMRRAGNVVLPSSALNAQGTSNVLGGVAAQTAARVRVGDGNLPGDDDKTIRHLEWSRGDFPSFALEAARAGGKSPDETAFHDGRAWIEIRGGPCNPDEPASCRIPTYGFSDVLEMLPNEARRAFGGKVVVVGLTVPSISRPLAVWSAGGGLTTAPHTAALQIATAVHDFPLRQAGMWLIVISILAGGLLPLVVDRTVRSFFGARGDARNALNGWYGALLTAVAGAAALLVLAAAIVLAFNLGTVVPAGAPLLAAFVAAIGLVGLRYVADTVNARQLYGAAQSVVPERYVRELVQHCARPGSEHFAEHREATVLFVDAVGFTALATALMTRAGDDKVAGAIQVHEVVSKYQELVIEQVFDRQGMIVDLMGDGVMVAFGIVGEQQPDHQALALATANASSTTVVEQMRAWLKQRGLDRVIAEERLAAGETDGRDEFDVVIGLDTDSVAVGLTGHQHRYEFSVIGPATNAASRLQQIAKARNMTLCTSHRTFVETLSPETKTLVPAERLEEQPIELRGQRGVPTILYGWKRDD